MVVVEVSVVVVGVSEGLVVGAGVVGVVVGVTGGDGEIWPGVVGVVAMLVVLVVLTRDRHLS